MMRAGVVKRPRERENSGYREIQKPPSRYGIIDLLELNALFVGGERMAPVAYDKELTALIVIDPYNDFISEGGKLGTAFGLLQKQMIVFLICCKS